MSQSRQGTPSVTATCLVTFISITFGGNQANLNSANALDLRDASYEMLGNRFI